MANRGPSYDKHVFCIRDLEEQASKKMPKMFRDYFNEGAMDLLTLADNRAAFDRYKIRPRVLVDVSNIDTSTTILGTKVAFPLGFSPAAMHRLAHPDGEVGTSRAAANMGVAMGLSTYSNDSMEDVIAQGKGNPYAYQVTLVRDKQVVIDMIKRAEKAGFKALFLTIDAPFLGKRLNEYRNSFAMPKGTVYPNLGDFNCDNLEKSDERLAYENSMDWGQVAAFMRANTKLPVWIKGIYTPDDVALAIRHGFDGVIISNHGGRQLDSVPATLDALRECAPVAKGRIPIAIDSGIRRGTDIFKALALGADFCFVGRVPIWGLAYNGSKGVELALQLLLHEFTLAMGLTGCKNVSEINRGHLSILNGDGVLSKL
ncbi:FMN-dependent dehydrogenase [Pleurostoma richardsiae]|uniref:Oxidase FUB9 n=1 Tax=Pleurostoma richardsiae TaxID=41990 RepID=A0AA38RAD6_9PEZI|nr:FMN-dependent dehydrogenase [Pleurostoma richardsiae]